MSTLQQSVRQRRDADPDAPACVSVGEQTPGLVIAAWQSESWVLPWSHLVSVRWDGSDGEEQLSLAFTSHAVAVQGRNLRPLLADVAGFRLGYLRELPPEYRSRFPADAPFISGIEVRALAPGMP